MTKIFLAAPLSCYDKNDLQNSRKEILNIIYFLESELDDIQLFYAGTQKNIITQFDSPFKSAEIDFAEIENANCFVLIYPEKIATSALVEIGYAIAKKKNIKIFTKSFNTLPFLLQEINMVFDFVEISIFENSLLNHIKTLIKKNKNYFA